MPDAFGPRSPGHVTLEKVSRSFEDTPVLLDASFTCHAGTVASVVGENGSGKTSLLRLIGGSLLPDAGTISVGHRSAGEEPVGIVSAGDRALFWRLSGRQNIEFFGRICGVTRSAIDSAVESAAEAVGATELLSKQAGVCSTGQRRRLMVACALVSHPSTLLFDEPFADLDDEGVTAIRGVVRAWAEMGGVILSAAPNAEAAPEPDLLLHVRQGIVEL